MSKQKINNICGWLAGLIAFVVYFKTMEPTASFWDCGEFLSCAFKLEVGHAPGAPFFLMLQRLFAIFAPSPSKVALFINTLSALSSALTIVFLFWTITRLLGKLIRSENLVLVMAAGFIGSLAFTFSDTFWFSAVEAEVYATSSLFTAVTFWAILKWDNVADNKYADRWLLFIAYMIGISIGVHLLNLLTIPAIALVYYFRRYEPTLKGFFVAFFAGCGALLLVQFGVIICIPAIAAAFDLFFTNGIGLPFDVGSICFLILFIAGLVWALFYAKKKSKYLLHTGVLSLLFIIIGYLSYLLPVIRSRANPPINLGNPANALRLQSYLSRDVFEIQPLLYGPDFSSHFTGFKNGEKIYEEGKKNDKDIYDVIGVKRVPEFEPERLFPRIYDNSAYSKVKFYRNYLGLENDQVASGGDNFSFFFHYQLNWMWFRYFMWNYAGRQNDFQGQGEARNGNWISGISILDELRGLGNSSLMPNAYKNNTANNPLYFLPLILGISGLVYQLRKNKKSGLVLLTFFLFTGPAIAVYLNIFPLQPREGDYAFVGCTYVFAIWIGLGVYALEQALQKYIKGKTATTIAVLICLSVPLLMVCEEWASHDRSKKTLVRDTAYNTLMSLAPNSILVTYEDNATGPLWFLQEVEQVRKDVRIVNVGLMGIDINIEQLNNKINDAEPVPMIWQKEDYMGERHNYTQYSENPLIPKDKYFSLEEICKFITSKDQANKIQTGADKTVDNYLPTKNFFLPTLNKTDLVTMHLADAADTNRINTEMKFTFPNNLVNKSDLAIFNIVAAVAKQGWQRPVYFDVSLPAGIYAGMNDYLKLNGIAYRLLPYKSTDTNLYSKSQMGSVDLDNSYHLFMNTYRWGGAERNDVYFDETNRKILGVYRLQAARIAKNLAAAGRKDDAVKLLDKVSDNITEHSFYYDITAYSIADAYYKAGEKEKGRKIATGTIKNSEAELKWLEELSDERKQQMALNVNLLQDIQIIGSLGTAMQAAGDSVAGDAYGSEADTWYQKLKPFIDFANQHNQ